MSRELISAAPSSALLGASLGSNIVSRSRNYRRSYSFTRSRPSRTRNMIDWNHPGEEENPCGITVHSHSPSWVHAAVRGIKSLLMAHWKNPLIKSVVLNTLEFPISERRSSTTGSGRTGIMLCSLIFIVTRLPYTSISFATTTKGLTQFE